MSLNSEYASRIGIFVAAVDSTAGDQSSADFVCTGTADDVTINQAIVAAATVGGAGGGNVYLCAGNYSVSNPINCNQNGTRLVGANQWRGTAFSADPNPLASIKLANGVNTDIIQVSGRKVWISNLFLDGNRANNTTSNISPTYTDASLTNGSPVVTSVSAGWVPQDIGKTITGPGIPAGTTILSLNFGTAQATLSANATSTLTNSSITIVNRFTAGHGISQTAYNVSADLHVSYCYIFKCAGYALEIWGSQTQVDHVLPEQCGLGGVHVSGSAAHCKFTVVTSNGNIGPGLIDDSIPQLGLGLSEAVSQNSYVQFDSGSNTSTGVILKGGIGKLFVNSIVQNSKDDGIEVIGGAIGVVIQGCSISNNGTASTGTYAGIHLAEDPSTGLYPSGVLVNGNNIITEKGNGMNQFFLAYGIREDGSGTQPNLITNNTISGNAPTVAGILQSNPSTLVAYNIGFQTANNGTATVASGTTSFIVTHGLAITPQISKVVLTMQNNPTNPISSPWVSNVTSTQFQINVSANPGTSGAIISWAVLP